MRGQPSRSRAAWPLVAVVLALATSTILGADASWVSATNLRPATSPRQAQVDALSVAAPSRAEASRWGLGAQVLVDYAADALVMRAGWLPPAPAAVAPAPATKPTTTTTALGAATTSTQVWWKRYKGSNHVWMPSLGLSKAVSFFSCTRSRDPDNLVYRYGCAGANNVYLLGHAGGVFKPVHDAYYNGKLKKGMPVVYADGNGKVRLYRVTTWRVVNPYDAAWALASQPVASMTLQTCVGKNDSLRLIVRLVRVDK